MQNINTTIKVLGTKYTIEFKELHEDENFKRCDGYMDKTSKKIVILSKNNPDTDLEKFELYQNKVIRHEIIHAFFTESGLDNNIENINLGVPETYVDWIAIQFPKIYKVFKKLDILE